MPDAGSITAPASPPVGSGRQPADGSCALAADLDVLEMLPVTDPAGALPKARAALRQARRSGDTVLEMRVRLIEADITGRMGRTTLGGQMARQVNDWAAVHGEHYVLARSHRLLGMFFDRIGDFAASLEHSVRAAELLQEPASLRVRADHAFGHALALLRLHWFDEARERYAQVLDMAEEVGDSALTVKVLNDLAWLEDEAGNSSRGLELALHMKAFADARGVQLDAACLDTLAHARVVEGRYDLAVRELEPIIRDPNLHLRPSEGLAEVLRTAAQAQRGLGDHAGAHVTLQHCFRVCEERELADVRVQAMQELAELLAVEGRFEEAYHELKEFHEAAVALRSSEREARAHKLQAVFELAEARRQGEHFRELAVTDPLTGLFNRRHVDSQLPSLLRASGLDGMHVAVALVDIDHFKRVNDTLSHSVGDEVLRRVASVLESVVGDRGFAARMGGEEFLLVLRDESRETALERWHAALTSVRSYPWQALTVGLPVTISIGAAMTDSNGVSQSELLAEADRNLYRAKHRGRDTVVAS